MKKILILLIIFSSFVVLKETRANIISIEDNDLVISEEKKRIQGVPKGLSAEDAYRVTKGENKILKDKKGERKFIFSFPVEDKIIFSDKLISYSEEKGWGEEIVIRTQELSGNSTLLFLGLQTVGILLISVINAKKLWVFYSYILASAIIGASVGHFAGICASFIGFIVIVYYHNELYYPVNIHVSRYVSFFVSMFAGVFTEVFTEGREKYLIFLVVVQAISFLIALIIKKRSWPFSSIPPFLSNFSSGGVGGK